MLLAGFYLGFFTTWPVLSALVYGETRCYCNEASCVRTAYMCKSSLGACFTLFTPDTAPGPGNTGIHFIHGCVDALTDLAQQTCHDDDVTRYDVIKPKSSSSASSEWPRLRCCKKDMCNYIDHVTHLGEVKRPNSRADMGGGYNGEAHDRLPYNDDTVPTTTTTSQQHQPRDIWFRVGVIAVPIIGAFILVCLVVIATRLLSVDRHRRRHHHHYHHHHHHHCGQQALACAASVTSPTNQSLLTTNYPLVKSELDQRTPIGQNSLVNINICSRTAPILTAHVMCVEPCCCSCTCKCKQVNHITTVYGQDYELIPSEVKVKSREEGGLFDKKTLNVLCNVHSNQSRGQSRGQSIIRGPASIHAASHTLLCDLPHTV